MKTSVLVIFALCLGTSLACNSMQRLLVKSEWASVFGTGLQRESFGREIWKRMYQLDPETPKLFARVDGDNIYSPKFVAHSYRILGGLDMCVALLDSDDTFNAQLAQLNRQHKERGISPDKFDTIRAAILDVMPTFMGKGFHDVDAWALCLKRVTDGIQA